MSEFPWANVSSCKTSHPLQTASTHLSSSTAVVFCQTKLVSYPVHCCCLHCVMCVHRWTVLVFLLNVWTPCRHDLCSRTSDVETDNRQVSSTRNTSSFLSSVVLHIWKSHAHKNKLSSAQDCDVWSLGNNRIKWGLLCLMNGEQTRWISPQLSEECDPRLPLFGWNH